MKRFSNSQYKSPPPPYQYAQCDHASHSPAKQGGVLVSVPPPPATPPVPSFQREGGVIGSVSSFASVCLSPSVSLCLPLSRAHACMRALSFLPHTLSERKCLLYHSPPPHTGTWTRRGRILGSHALRSAYGGEITRVHCPALLRSVQLTSCSMPANVALRSCRRASAMHAHTHAHATRTCARVHSLHAQTLRRSGGLPTSFINTRNRVASSYLSLLTASSN